MLAWGAFERDSHPARVRLPDEDRRLLQLDYSGGYGKYRRDYWKTFQNTCGPYHGPPIAWLVVACTATDGTSWALQSWQRDLPDLGVRPTQAQAAWELRLSHWSGPTAQLDVHTDWAYRKYDHLFGVLLYDDAPQYGFQEAAAAAEAARYLRS